MAGAMMTSLQTINVPLPGDPDEWVVLLASFAAIRRHLRELPPWPPGHSRLSKQRCSARG